MTRTRDLRPCDAVHAYACTVNRYHCALRYAAQRATTVSDVARLVRRVAAAERSTTAAHQRKDHRAVVGVTDVVEIEYPSIDVIQEGLRPTSRQRLFGWW